MSWLLPPAELTPEQQRAVQLSPLEHRAIIGGPGSGKTQILLHRARHLCDSLGVPPERFRILVFNNVLKDYIKTALRDLRLPEENVLTFDHWCRLFYQQHVSQRLPWDQQAKQPDFAAVRRAVMQRATNGRTALPLLDFVLVDEGQDLEEEVFAFLAKISRHVTVCFDNKQQIYDSGSTEAGILHKLGIRRRNVSLIEAFRVCPYLVDVAACLIPDVTEREAFRNQTRQPQTERQTPLIYFYKHFEDEKQMLFQVVRERQLKNERIAILLPQNRQVFGFAKGLLEVSIEAEVPAQKGRASEFPVHDFASSRPKLMTYYGAKGLTFDTVLMPRLVTGSFQRTHPGRVERLLFVAITRATRWCYFSTAQEDPMPILLDKLVPLAKQQRISLLEGTASALSETREGKECPDKNDQAKDLDFL